MQEMRSAEEVAMYDEMDSYEARVRDVWGSRLTERQVRRMLWDHSASFEEMGAELVSWRPSDDTWSTTDVLRWLGY